MQYNEKILQFVFQCELNSVLGFWESPLSIEGLIQIQPVLFFPPRFWVIFSDLSKVERIENALKL